MTKKCPQCGSTEVTLFIGGQTGSWKCKRCGYIGVLIIEEDSDEKG